MRSWKGISYIHSCNIIHNHISTRNVLIEADMTLKICDFGFSTIVGEKNSGLPEMRYGRFIPMQEISMPVIMVISSR